MKNNNQKTSPRVVKKEILFADIALFLLGLLMIIFKNQISAIICVAIGIILGIWGIIRLVKYFANDKTEALSSFGLAQGIALISFSVVFIIKPELLSGIVSVLLGIILIITGVVKLQYAVDMIKLKTKLWLVPLFGSIVSIALGVLSFIYTDMSWLMIFVGIALMVTAVWDLISVLLLARTSARNAEDNVIEVEATEVDTYDSYTE